MNTSDAAHAAKRRSLPVLREGLRLPLLCLYFSLSLIFLELMLRIFALKAFLGVGLLFIVLFSLPLALLFAVLSSLAGRRANTAVGAVLLFLATALCYGQTLYYSIFKTFTMLYSTAGAGKVTGYWREILAGIRATLLPLLLMSLPLVLWFVFGRRITPRRHAPWRAKAAMLALAAGFQLGGGWLASAMDQGALSPRYLYGENFIIEPAAKTFGIITTLRLDAKNLLGLMRDELPALPAPAAPVATNAPQEEAPVTYANNMLPIDFAALITEESNDALITLHNYFAAETPTRQNEKTGLWKGKNLIWFCAEGFSAYALDPEITPTLYRLANEGYVFENFYNPVWGVSTSDGEYTTCTGLIPKSGVWSLYQSSKNSMPFCLGNQLRAVGYGTYAYHDHTYDYYHRDLSHPNMGYLYKGVGNGLEMTLTWPESDLEMVDLTSGEYTGNQPYHTYYMTVSGHLRYSFLGNAMAAKNREVVAGVEGSEAVQAYLACNVELDRALELLLQRLEEAGELENTAIVLSGDHYPYGLEWEGLDALNEIAGRPLEQTFEKYKTALIMWAGDMPEAEPVQKPCAPVDILPTLSNLLGLEYDSRLLMGKDIFSDSPGLVVFNSRSWLSETGRYDAGTGVFTPAEGAEVPEGYVEEMNLRVKAQFSASAKILETDYYARVLPADWLAVRTPPEE